MEWKPHIRNYFRENLKNKVHLEPITTDDHPLKENKKSININCAKTNKSHFENVKTSWGGLDPLLTMLTEEEDNNFADFNKSTQADNFTSWQSRIDKALHDLSITVSCPITMDSKYVPLLNPTCQRPMTLRQTIDKRLTEINKFTDYHLGKIPKNVKFDLVDQVEKLNLAMHEAWEAENRINAMRAALQSAKMLASECNVKEYLTKFVLIIKMLEQFSIMVNNRIYSQILVDEGQGKHTCENWLQKVSSIRSLVPRLYFEMALFNLQKYMHTNEDSWLKNGPELLTKINRQIRGVSDPLIACYLQAKLAHIVLETFPTSNDIIDELFFDLIVRLARIKQQFLTWIKTQYSLDPDTYTQKFDFALDWIVSCFLISANEEKCEKAMLLIKYEMSECSEMQLMLLFKHLINKLNPEFLFKHYEKLLNLLEYIHDKNPDAFKDLALLETYCARLSSHKSLKTEIIDLLNRIWPFIKKQHPETLLKCIHSILPFIVYGQSLKQIKKVMSELILHLNNKDQTSSEVLLLNQILTLILESINLEKLIQLLCSEEFRRYIYLYQSSKNRANACKEMLSFTLQKLKENDMKLNDMSVIGRVLKLAKHAYTNVDVFSLSDEKRQIASFIHDIINCTDLGDDPEMNLEFLIDMRANFSKDESILVRLICEATKLAINYNKTSVSLIKRREFVSACIAFATVSIPSLDNPKRQMQMYLHTAHAALKLQCISQTEFLLKSAISTLDKYLREYPTVARQDEIFIQAYLSGMLSFLVVFPDNPQADHLVVANGILNLTKNAQHKLTFECQLFIHLQIIRYLSTVVQPTLPYHIDKVVSNDELYAGSTELKSIASDIVCELMLKITQNLNNLVQIPRRQGELALYCFETLIDCSEIDTVLEQQMQFWWLYKRSLQRKDEEKEKLTITRLEEKEMDINTDLGLLKKRIKELGSSV